MIQKGDRAGVMRAFEMHWVTASLLAEYKIGHDYTNKVNLLELLDSDQRQDDQKFFDLSSLEWCVIDYIHGHFGDLHIAQTVAENPDSIFLLSLLIERTGQSLVNVILFAKARWRMKRLRKEVANDLHQAALVCRASRKVMNHVELRSYFRCQLLRELVQSRFGKCWKV